MIDGVLLIFSEKKNIFREEHICLFLFKSGFCLRQAELQQQTHLSFCFNSSFQSWNFKNFIWNKFQIYRKVSNAKNSHLSPIQIFQLLTYTSSTPLSSPITLITCPLSLIIFGTIWEVADMMPHHPCVFHCISQKQEHCCQITINPWSLEVSIDSAAVQIMDPSQMLLIAVSLGKCTALTHHVILLQSGIFPQSFLIFCVLNSFIEYRAYIVKVDP